MKKETLTAVIFGIILGSLLGFFLIVKSKARSLKNTKTFSPKISITPSAKSMNSEFQLSSRKAEQLRIKIPLKSKEKRLKVRLLLFKHK